MKDKAFTLIELLAVIVILAIIALIATPIILGIINDARESAKKRSAELVYTGVEYAYTTSMYKLSSATGDISLQNIYDNFSVENTTKGTRPGDNDTSFTVTTSEGVDCVISTASNGYEVKCGIEDDDDKYLDKIVLTSTPMPLQPICLLESGTSQTIGSEYTCSLDTERTFLKLFKIDKYK